MSKYQRATAPYPRSFLHEHQYAVIEAEREAGRLANDIAHIGCSYSVLVSG